MSLDRWVANGWLVPHQASPQETNDLLDAARSDLDDARQDISPGWRFAIAYNAALRLCTAALQSAGYRPTRDQKHYRTLAALPLLLGSDVTELADTWTGAAPGVTRSLTKLCPPSRKRRPMS